MEGGREKKRRRDLEETVGEAVAGAGVASPGEGEGWTGFEVVFFRLVDGSRASGSGAVEGSTVLKLSGNFWGGAPRGKGGPVDGVGGGDDEIFAEIFVKADGNLSIDPVLVGSSEVVAGAR